MAPADDLFDEIKAKIEAGVAKMVGAVFQFDIKRTSGEVRTVTVDLKNAPGSLTEGKGSTKADCTFIMGEDDFVALLTGKLTGMKAFMQGKLKIKGNMGLAQKLTPEVFSAPLPSAASGSSGSDFQCSEIFAQMKAAVQSGNAKMINAVFQFDITNADKKLGVWTVDLNAPGSVSEGKTDKKVDCTFVMKDADFVALQTGKLTGMKAFMQGKLKVKGNMGLAQKFTPDIFTAKL